jgi:hypothetical protein
MSIAVEAVRPSQTNTYVPTRGTFREAAFGWLVAFTVSTLMCVALVWAVTR